MYISKEGIVRGEVHSAQGVYTIRSDVGNKNQVLIKEMDMSQIRREGDDVMTVDPELLRNFSGDLKKTFRQQSTPMNQRLSENQTVDVLALYTTSLLIEASIRVKWKKPIRLFATAVSTGKLI